MVVGRIVSIDGVVDEPSDYGSDLLSNYSRGADFERTFLQELHSGEDHLYAMRSAGSHGALDIIELRRRFGEQSSRGPISVWGYQLKSGKQPKFQSYEIDYLEFLEEAGIHIRVVWKPARKARRIFTVEQARDEFSKPVRHRAIRKDAKI